MTFDPLAIAAMVVGFGLGAMFMAMFWWWEENSWRFDEYPWWQVPFVALLGPVFAFLGLVANMFVSWLDKVRKDATS